MHITPLLADVRRLMPSFTPNPSDRVHAWNEWLGRGGSEPVLKFIRWSNGTNADDDEILQETLLTAYMKVECGQFEDRSVPFTAFLKKIAWYKIMEASRRDAGSVSLDDVGEFVTEDSGESERAEYWREHEALQAALVKLPPRRSRIILLYENGYTTAEIAESLGIREELVRKEKSLGLRQLRETVITQLAG
ncbi:MAG: sigma-70 family RNA polymerase sigma factor [bacterium]|nr:sigma-70 family RNA polymerase sigma factor [bacterium]